MADPAPFAYPVPLLPRDVERLLAERRPEGDQLDYKSDWWRDQRRKWEPAKDVGALANHLGGHIVIGVTEERDEISRSTLPGEVVGVELDGKPRQMLTQALHNWLEPREVADLVDVTELTVRGKTVLLVTVRPLIDGIAVVDRNGGADPQFSVPLRRGDDTYWASWRQVEERMSTSGRRAYLRAQQLTQGNRPGQYHMQIASQVLIRTVKGLKRPHVPRSGHGRSITPLTPEGMVLDLSLASDEYRDMQNLRIDDSPLFVPWSVVDELWLEERGGGEVPRLCILLRVAVLLQHGRYSLTAAYSPAG